MRSSGSTGEAVCRIPASRPRQNVCSRCPSQPYGRPGGEWLALCGPTAIENSDRFPGLYLESEPRPCWRLLIILAVELMQRETFGEAEGEGNFVRRGWGWRYEVDFGVQMVYEMSLRISGAGSCIDVDRGCVGGGLVRSACLFGNRA